MRAGLIPWMFSMLGSGYASPSRRKSGRGPHDRVLAFFPLRLQTDAKRKAKQKRERKAVLRLRAFCGGGWN